MKRNSNSQNTMTSRENLLMSLLHKITKEYKSLLSHIRQIKPYKIIEIRALSSVPGESEFLIQITNKNCVFRLTAAQIIQEGYKLEDFNGYHAEIIRQAAQGKLIEFLKTTDCEPKFKIISKRLDRESQQYLFAIEASDGKRFIRTAEEIAQDINILKNLGFHDVYDIGYTQGCESILKEKVMLLIAKTRAG